MISLAALRTAASACLATAEQSLAVERARVRAEIATACERNEPIGQGYMDGLNALRERVRVARAVVEALDDQTEAGR